MSLVKKGESKMNNLVYTNEFNVDLMSLQNNFFSYLDVKPKTMQTYTIALRQFFTYVERHNIKQPTRDDIIKYREELSKTCKPTTVQGYLIALRQFFKWTEMLNLYPNITNNVKGIKIDNTHKKDSLTIIQAKELLNNISNLRDYAILSLMMTCGIRTIEVERANIEDIQQMGDCKVLFVQGKGRDGKSEYIKLPDNIYNILIKYVNTRTDNNKALFVSQGNRNFGERIVTRTISYLVKEYFKRY
jgi:integrase/recombinase XerD